MQKQEPFDLGKVATLTGELDDALKQLARLRAESAEASSRANTADVRVLNLRTELTRAVEAQLDYSILHSPKMLPAE